MTTARRLAILAGACDAAGTLLALAGLGNLEWALELALLLTGLATASTALVLAHRGRARRLAAGAAAALLPALLVALWLAALLWAGAHGGLD